jgi:23S rRNA (guanosine2251-2'-O)-methyltransferase
MLLHEARAIPRAPFYECMKRLTTEELRSIRLREEVSAERTNRFPLIAILENVRSLYNVGSMFRTSDAVRLEAIYTVGYTPHPPRAEIEKTALGATRTVPSQHFETIGEAIAAARSRSFHVAALELTDHSTSLFALDRENFPLALIVGNEVTGVSDEGLAQCDRSIEIPMIGAKHSLNVAVAYGVAVFEALRIFKDDLGRFRP